MNAINATIDFEVTEWFDADGTLMIDVYIKGQEEPVLTHEVKLRDSIHEFIDISSVDGVIVDGEDEDIAYEIIDELQLCIDNLNNALEDYDEV